MECGKEPSDDKMGLMDAGTLILFGIILPTTDVYSDLAFITKLLSKGHINYALSMLAPVILSFLLLIPHWLRIEKTAKKRLGSLLFVILQIWPQTQAAKIVKMGLYDKNPLWRSKKDSMERDISSVGKVFL